MAEVLNLKIWHTNPTLNLPEWDDVGKNEIQRWMKCPHLKLHHIVSERFRLLCSNDLAFTHELYREKMIPSRNGNYARSSFIIMLCKWILFLNGFVSLHKMLVSLFVSVTAMQIIQVQFAWPVTFYTSIHIWKYY